MPTRFYDRIKETTTTTGTGDLSLAGAATGFRKFNSVLADGELAYYAVVGGAEWETGLGTYESTGDVWKRTTVYESSNANAAVNFSAGTKDIFLTIPAGWANNTVGTLHFEFGTVLDETRSICAYMPFAGVVSDIKQIKTKSGTCTANIKIGSTSITGLSALSVTSSAQNAAATNNLTFAVGDSINIEITSSDLAFNLQGDLLIKRL